MEITDDIGIWSANETVYNAGTPPEYNYLVIEGSVKITAPNGYYLGDVGQGELFGKPHLYSAQNDPQLWSQALTD